MEQIDIWDLGTKINVKVRPEFLEYINNEIKKQFNTKRNIYKFVNYNNSSYLTFKSRLKKSYKNFVDLEIFLKLCNLLKIPLYNLQKNIVAYKTRKGWNYIENPKLPITITPIFDMLVAHHIGDGCLMNCHGNRKNYFAYKQFDKQYRDLYIKKIESLFGRINYKSKYIDDEKTTQVYSPTFVSEIMYRLYNLNERSFISETARIPKEIFRKDWRHKLAFLIGIIIDEGNIDSTLAVIRMKNIEFIQDLSKICDDLGYMHTIKVKNNNFACLYILASGLGKFYKDYLILLNEYPEVDLGYKGVKIKEFIDRLNKNKIYRPGNKKILLELLSKENLTVNELATKLNMTRQGTRYLINQLDTEDKIEVKSIVKFANYKYGLK